VIGPKGCALAETIETAAYRERFNTQSKLDGTSGIGLNLNGWRYWHFDHWHFDDWHLRNVHTDARTNHRGRKRLEDDRSKSSGRDTKMNSAGRNLIFHPRAPGFQFYKLNFWADGD
jgi:hypothetical protein